MAGMAGTWAAAMRQRAHRVWAAVRAARRGRRISTTVIVLILTVGVLQLWTWGPDTVRVTVMQRTGDGHSYVIYDHTIHDAPLAQQLQRDMASFPIDENPLDTYSCSMSNGTYILQWSRFDLLTEIAVETECPSMWMEDGIISRIDRTQQGLLPDLAALGVPHPGPPWQLAQPTP